jgi:hypothetical protein
VRNNSLSVVFGMAVLTLIPSWSLAAPSALWSVTIAGRPIEAQGEYALYEDGTMSVNLVDFARALGGVMIYRTENGAEVQLKKRHIAFTTGIKRALLDDAPVPLPSAPFARGERYYVPLRTLALVAGLTVAFDRQGSQVHLTLPRTVVPPTPLSSQLVLAAAGSIAPDGLHLTATAANLTGAPLKVVFPTSARVAFTATRDGRMLWNSVSGMRAEETVSTMMFTANAAKSFAGFWPGFLSAGPGIIHIGAEVLSTPPLFAPLFDVAGLSISPSPTPTAMPSSFSSAEPGPTLQPAGVATPSPSATAIATATPRHHRRFWPRL